MTLESLLNWLATKPDYEVTFTPRNQIIVTDINDGTEAVAVLTFPITETAFRTLFLDQVPAAHAAIRDQYSDNHTVFRDADTYEGERPKFPRRRTDDDCGGELVPA